MKKVNLFVVGAMKAGTTSFVDLLSQSEEVYIPPIKEPHYFVNKLPKSIYKPSRFFDLDHYFKNEFPKPLHITKLNSLEQYQKIYSLTKKQHKYLVDASTCYLNSPESAELILNYNPEAKIIILLRDPLKRAISHYQMDVGLGRTLKPFEEEILKNLNDFKKGQLSSFSYLNMSFYKNQVEIYKQFFGSQVLILDFEKLIKNDLNEYSKINQFLKLSTKFANLPRQNKTRKLYFPVLNSFLTKAGFRDIFSKITPNFIKQKIFNLITSEKRTATQISTETLKELRSHFDALSVYDLNQYK